MTTTYEGVVVRKLPPGAEPRADDTVGIKGGQRYISKQNQAKAERQAIWLAQSLKNTIGRDPSRQEQRKAKARNRAK